MNKNKQLAKILIESAKELLKEEDGPSLSLKQLLNMNPSEIERFDFDILMNKFVKEFENYMMDLSPFDAKTTMTEQLIDFITKKSK